MNEIKPTWKLAWGLFWRIWVIWISIGLPFIILKWVLKLGFNIDLAEIWSL